MNGMVGEVTHLSGDSDEAEEVELQEADHDLVELIHGCKDMSVLSANPEEKVNALFIAGLAPTTWNIAQLQPCQRASHYERIK